MNTIMPVNPFRQARYLLSAHHLAQLPPDTGSEVAFAGRSNAGKSSALNAITDHTRLAHTSKTPGRTQQINFFTVEQPDCRFVDLPGYGYAEVPASLREHWRQVIDSYLRDRQSLCGLVLIMDIRHPLRSFDRMMLTFCTEIGRPVHCLLTKADKLNRGAALQELSKVQRELETMNCSATSVQLFSSLAKTGVDEARALLARWLKLDLTSPG